MKNSTMNTIYTTLNTINFEGKEEVMQELYNELHRNDRVKEEKANAYAVAWETIKTTINDLGAPTLSEIWDCCKENLPDGFTKSKVSYGLTHYWKDYVNKIEGKVNMYQLKEGE